MKGIAIILISALLMTACAQKDAPHNQGGTDSAIAADVDNADISKALKITLKGGVSEGSKKLKQQRNQFSLKSSDYTPSQIENIIKTLYKLDQIDLVNELDRILAHDASGIVNSANPIFNHSIDHISFGDAYRILMRGENAATKFLKDHASPEIKAKLQPEIEKILKKSGADDVWSEILAVYNQATGNNVQLNLAAYMADDVIRRMFNEIAAHEVKVRLNDYLRTTLILQEVFKLQDGVSLQKLKL